MRKLGRFVYDQGGVALVTTLLFMVLMLILISAMLTVSSNEIAISGGQRDASRALEVAEGGIREAIRRIEIPHFFATNSAQECYDGNPADDQTFTNSLSPGTATVKICRHEVGPSGAILEIQSDARVNVARRRLSAIVRQIVDFLPPNILYGQNIAEQGNAAELASGDAYSQTFIRYVTLPSAGTLSYGGWRISKKNPGPIPACYSHADCVADALLDGNDCATSPGSDARCRWYPGQRITVPLSSTLGIDLNAKKAQCVGAGDPNGAGTPTFANTYLPAGAILAEDPSQNPIAADSVWAYGFDRDDPPGAEGTQAVTPNLPCGFPYKYELVELKDEDGNTVDQVYFKTIVYEHWFLNYYRFDNSDLAWGRRDGTSPCPDDPQDSADQNNCLSGVSPSREPNLDNNPQFAAVPPFPDFNAFAANADRTMTVPQTINSGDFGVCEDLVAPANDCEGTNSRPIIVLMDGGNPASDDWHINGNLEGHGTVLVNGDLIVNGTFTYWGTLIVNGNLTLGSGTVTIYGGLVAKSTAYLTGNITVRAGGLVPNIPVGSARVTTLTWWER